MAVETRVDANVDYGVLSGYFVRLDVQDEDQAKRWVWTGLAPDEARRLAKRLLEMADQVEALNNGRGGQEAPVPTNR